LVGVPPELLAACTAVHADVAEAMARGALERGDANLALSVTGVTGAEPDEDGNPIGRVFVGFAAPGMLRASIANPGGLRRPRCRISPCKLR
jgi:nicotinamide-nucleotide amidase